MLNVLVIAYTQCLYIFPLLQHSLLTSSVPSVSAYVAALKDLREARRDIPAHRLVSPARSFCIFASCTHQVSKCGPAETTPKPTARQQ